MHQPQSKSRGPEKACSLSFLSFPFLFSFFPFFLSFSLFPFPPFCVLQQPYLGLLDAGRVPGTEIFAAKGKYLGCVPTQKLRSFADDALDCSQRLLAFCKNAQKVTEKKTKKRKQKKK
jgi:hypothetical protein